MANILAVCSGNNIRSQIAEGYLRYFVRGGANVYSAGIDNKGIDPITVYYAGRWY